MWFTKSKPATHDDVNQILLQISQLNLMLKRIETDLTLNAMRREFKEEERRTGKSSLQNSLNRLH